MYPRREDLSDPRVTEPTEHLGLVLEPPPGAVRLGADAQRLECDAASWFGLDGFVDRAHAPASEHADDLELAEAIARPSGAEPEQACRRVGGQRVASTGQARVDFQQTLDLAA